MTDINKTILEKAAGPTRFNPDEQRRFLETYEERVIASCTLEEARDNLYLEHYSSILTNISERFEPVLVKISPALDESSQLQYLKKQRILVLWQALFQMTVATLPLVSSSILIIHLEFLQPISASSIQICLKRRKRAQHLKKNHFGNASLAKERTN